MRAELLGLLTGAKAPATELAQHGAGVFLAHLALDASRLGTPDASRHSNKLRVRVCPIEYVPNSRC